MSEGKQENQYPRYCHAAERRGTSGVVGHDRVCRRRGFCGWPVKSRSPLSVEKELFDMCIETTNHTIPSVKLSLPCNNLLLPTSIHDDATFSLLTECSIPVSETHEEPKNQKTLPERSNLQHTPFTPQWIVARIHDS